jgi:hypothetical protein
MRAMSALARVGLFRAAAGLVVVLAVVAWWLVPMTPLGVPSLVRDRSPLPSCGEETGTQSGSRNPEARRCFWDAYLAGRPAELISTRPTVEGDPITSIYRILPAGSIEVFVDQRRDRYSRGGWYRLGCLDLALNGGPGQAWYPDFVCGAPATPTWL